MPSNPLTNLLQQYNSDSEDEDQQSNNNTKTKGLDRKVDDFLKEIQHIAPASTNNEVALQPNGTHWQECYDESSGYPYYWNTQTNQVTWELPKEIELARSKVAPPPASTFPRPNNTFNNFKMMEDNIPEGMIPKEVVERSKNRFREKKKTVPSKIKKKLETARESDSDDGKIEMITSFGSDGTDSEPEEPARNTSPAEPAAAARSTTGTIGPSMPHYHHPPEKSRENGEKSSSEERNTKFSLVPGYGDDSDNDEDGTGERTKPKALFPIGDYDEKTLIHAKRMKLQHLSEEDSNSASENKKIEEKRNMFLETSADAPSRFKRKRRIAFDVRPKNDPKIEARNEVKSEVKCDVRIEGNSDSQDKTDLIRGNEERLGLGFTRSSAEIEDNTSTNDSDKNSTDEEKSDSAISFVRGETLKAVVEEQKTEAEKAETKSEVDMVLEKLKFLSEGVQSVSAVQIMIIQLQTLLTAWEAGDLKDRYLDNWLSGTSSELSRLEKAAAPSGWNCQWDRSHKRYYYQNESTGETSWNYPDVIGGAEEMELCTTPPPPENEEEEEEEAAAATADKMVNGIDDSEKSCGAAEASKSDGNGGQSTDKPEIPQEMIPPPPPQISSPSPPPPPRISSDDEQKTIKKVNGDEKTIGDNKPTPEAERSISVPPVLGTEPLPPGVDSPDIAFPLAPAHPSMEPAVIFATTPQPANAATAMYAAATMQDPTSVPLIGHHHHHHHHPALLQSQLVHYPAYHQHLHNQAILAAANRLTGQDTVQFVLDFPRIYTNTQVISKPPVTTSKESLGSALNSFYNDIASLERPPEEPQKIQSPAPTPAEAQIVNTVPQDAADKASVVNSDKDKRKFAEERCTLLLSNAPAAQLITFLKTIFVKMTGKKDEPLKNPLREKLLTNSKLGGAQDISPATNAELAQAKERALSVANSRKTITTPSPSNVRKRKLTGTNTTKGPIAKKLYMNPTAVELTDEQKAVLDAVLKGKNIFFTGSAGTGKSFLLKRIIAELPPDVTTPTASTGVAACHIGGITLHQFAGVGLGTGTVERCCQMASRPAVSSIWRRTKYLIIDEISMVDGEFFEKLEAVARYVRKNDRPFGGIQLILCGDFFQLPPVNKMNETRKFCFQSKIWDKCVHLNFELQTVHRQKDAEFVRVLNSIRIGRVTDEITSVLKQTSGQKIEKDGILATRLCSHVNEANEINDSQLGNLKGEAKIYVAQDSDESMTKTLDQQLPVPGKLTLKVGAQVMLLKNINISTGLVNGARGVVLRFENDTPVVQFRTGEIYHARSEKWSFKTAAGGFYHRKQVPLKLAWAFSIHKSQGLTLDCVEMSLAKVFDAGQAYVALSRAQSLDSLRVLDFNPRQVWADTSVLQFYKNFRRALHEIEYMPLGKKNRVK